MTRGREPRSDWADGSSCSCQCKACWAVTVISPFGLTGRGRGRSWVGWFSSWDKEGGGHRETCWTGLDACIQTEAKQEQISRPLGIKRKLAEDSRTLFCGEVPLYWEMVTKGWKVREDQEKEGEKQGRHFQDKSRELLMQHDPVGPALKIPLGRRVASISICLITW